MFKFKRDTYGKIRGKPVLLDIYCAKCGEKVLVYQKDGTGHLHRCYLNRIFAPPELASLHSDVVQHKAFPRLVCKKCNTVIGIPMKHKDGRPAFRLIPNLFFKEINRDFKHLR